MIFYYLSDRLGLFQLIIAILGTFVLLVFLIVNFARNFNRSDDQNVLRGAKLTTNQALEASFKQKSTPQSSPLNLPQLEIAGIPIPQNLENRGFFMFGSPGTGKTQAISQMTATIGGVVKLLK